MTHVAFHTFPVPDNSSPAFSSLAFSAPPIKHRWKRRNVATATVTHQLQKQRVQAIGCKHLVTCTCWWVRSLHRCTKRIKGFGWLDAELNETVSSCPNVVTVDVLSLSVWIFSFQLTSPQERTLSELPHTWVIRRNRAAFNAHFDFRTFCTNMIS